jgi:hypothetical protein
VVASRIIALRDHVSVENERNGCNLDDFSGTARLVAV